MRRSLQILTVLGCFLASTPSLIAQCGVERWSVKTGTDADVGLVNLGSSTLNTIATMRGWPAPSPIPANNRVSPYETTQWVLNATLTQYKLESDSDYHLVLQDASGNTLIAEIPSPNCVGTGSPFGPGIQNARNQFDAKYTATSSFKTANIPVQVKGVGMFDFLHGQTGVAPNGIEIHPVLDIIFNPGTSSDFSISSAPISLSVAQGSAGNSTISTSITGSFNSAVALTASGAPTGTTVSFSPSSIAAPGSGSSMMSISVGASTAAGTYSITVTGTGGGKTHATVVTLTVTATGGGVTTLSNGQTVSSLSGATGAYQYFKITVPTGQSSLAVTTSGGTGDEDVYLKLGSQPTTTTYDYRGIVSGNAENVTVTNPGAGDWYIGLYGYAAYSGVSLTATYSGGGGGTQQLLGNPGFETGTASPWTTSSGVVTNAAGETAHGGTWMAWLDGYGSAHTDTLLQTVTIPSTATSASLSFWLHIDSAETTTTTAYDTLKVQIRNSSGTVLATLATYSNLNKATGYTQKSFNVLTYKGQTIQVYLVGVEDSVSQTSFVVDDFLLNVQ
jgi:hypothetical protein